MRFWFWDSVVLLQTLALAGDLLLNFLLLVAYFRTMLSLRPA